MVNDIAVQDFVNAIKEEPQDTNKTYNATVSYIDNEGVVWVYLQGSDKETPTASTSTEVQKGDSVTVQWRNNKLYIGGNYSNPSAGVVRVANVEQDAARAFTAAENAEHDAARAHEAAEQAEASAEEAKTQAQRATGYANDSLSQLSIVEDVVGTLNWIMTHATYKLTEDTTVHAGKWYFTKSGDNYNAVINPTGNPQAQGWYEVDTIDEAVSNYVASHLSLTNAGLWVTKDNQGYKVLLANDGLKIYDAGGHLVSTFGENITYDSARPQTIGNQSTYIKWYDSDNDNVADSIEIAGANVNIASSVTIGGMPTKVSDLTNDSGYQTASDVSGTIVSTTTLYYASNSTTPPSKPSAHVTTDSTSTRGAWNIALPTYSDSYPYLYVCTETKTKGGTYGWTSVEQTTYASAISAIKTTADSAAPKSSAIARSQRIYWRATSTSGKPSANTTWLATSGTGYGNWSLSIPQLTSGTTKYPYLYTAVQTQTVSQQAAGNTCSCSTVLLDDTTTVIDGGTIITGTVNANAVNASSGTFDTANIPNLNASKITAGDIAADRMKANSITAINSLTTGKIDAARLNVGQITVSSLNNDSGFQTASQVSATATSAATTAVNELEIGGTNLLSNLESAWEQGTFKESSGAGTSYEDMKTGSNYRIRIKNLLPVESSVQYTVSAAHGYDFFLAYLGDSGYLGTHCQTWKSAPYTFTTSDDCTGVAITVCKHDSSTIAPSDIVNAKIKFEQGAKATTWAPSPEDVQDYTDSAISTATSDMATNTGVANTYATKAAAASEEQRIYYRSNSSSAPTAPSTWVTSTSTANTTWTTKRMQYDSTYKYLWTCIQKKTVSGAITNSTVLLDDTTTVIDGGNIITGTVLANAVKADSGQFNSALIPNLDAEKITTGTINIGRMPSDTLNSNVQVGGRNLLLNSANYDPSKAPYSNSNVSTYSGTFDTYQYYYCSGTKYVQVDFPTLESGVEYAISFDIARSSVTPIYVTVGGTTVNIGDTLASAWKRASYVFTASSSTTYARIQVNNTSSADNWIAAFKNFKLERGNKATDWLPAPEDVQSEIDYAQALSSAKRISTWSRSFTKAQWEIYGTAKRSESWGTSSAYNNSHISVGDSAYVTGSVSDQAGLYVAVLGTVTSVSASSVVMTSSVLLYNSAQAEKYITTINDTGIRIHPSSTENDSVVINANGMDVYKGGTSVAKYGDTARIGKESSGNGNVLTKSTGMDLRVGTTTVGSLTQGTYTDRWNTSHNNTLMLDATQMFVLRTGNDVVMDAVSNGSTFYADNAQLDFNGDSTDGAWVGLSAGNGVNTYDSAYMSFTNSTGTSIDVGVMYDWGEEETEEFGIWSDSTPEARWVLGGTPAGYIMCPGIYANTSSGGSNVRILGTGDPDYQLRRYVSSSRRYKEDIEDISDESLDPNRLYDARVVQFRYKEDYLDYNDQRYGKLVGGFIAEELEEVYPIAVQYEDEMAEDWEPKFIIPPMLKLIQDQKKKIDELEERIEALERK